jgi:hydrogenase/urease accessory protein HupE
MIMMRRRRAPRLRAARLVVMMGLALAGARAAHAHPIDAATLTLTEVEPGRFRVHFQAGSWTLQQQVGAAPAVFPASCRLDAADLRCHPPGLAGEIQFPWLEGTLTRLMVEIEWLDGARLLRIATAGARTITVYGRASGLGALRPVVVDYMRLGVEHILTGFDHLLFVVGLTLLVRKRRSLITTITAFTAAHSLTLASTVLGLVSVPSAPVEATIALSIVLVCAECLRPDDSLTRRAPWLVAFVFGLLHGLGFASALMEIGLPEKHIPTALVCFNVGVELGQLAVIAAVLAVRALADRLRLRRPWLARGVVYAMGATAAFWSLDRMAAVFGR